MNLVRAALLNTVNPNTSDGRHTFRELYRHRHALFLLVIKWSPMGALPWYSRKHHKAGPPMQPNTLVAGLELPNGPITYYMPVEYAPLLDRAGAAEQTNAPQWNGHTPSDVFDLLLLAVNNGDELPISIAQFP